MKKTKKYFGVRGRYRGRIVSAMHIPMSCGCGMCDECYGRITVYTLYERGVELKRWISSVEIDATMVPLNDYYTQEDLFEICLEYGTLLKLASQRRHE